MTSVPFIRQLLVLETLPKCFRPSVTFDCEIIGLDCFRNYKAWVDYSGLQVWAIACKEFIWDYLIAKVDDSDFNFIWFARSRPSLPSFLGDKTASYELLRQTVSMQDDVAEMLTGRNLTLAAVRLSAFLKVSTFRLAIGDSRYSLSARTIGTICASFLSLSCTSLAISSIDLPSSSQWSTSIWRFLTWDSNTRFCSVEAMTKVARSSGVVSGNMSPLPVISPWLDTRRKKLFYPVISVIAV